MTPMLIITTWKYTLLKNQQVLALCHQTYQKNCLLWVWLGRQLEWLAVKQAAEVKEEVFNPFCNRSGSIIFMENCIICVIITSITHSVNKG